MTSHRQIVYLPLIGSEVETDKIEDALKQYGNLVDKKFLSPPGATIKSAYFIFEDEASVNMCLAGEISKTVKVEDHELTVKRVSSFQKSEIVKSFPTLFEQDGDVDEFDAILSMFDSLTDEQRSSTLNRLSVIAGSGVWNPAVRTGTGGNLTLGTGSGPGTSSSGDGIAVNNITRVSHGGSTTIPTPLGGSSIVIENAAGPPRRLRLFSGKTPVPNGEVDYEDWRLCAKQMLDNTRNESEKKRTLMDSLLRPALSLVSHLGGAPADQIFAELELIYGKVHDKFGVMAAVHSTLMLNKEKPSQYLQRIYTVVTEAADCGAIERSEVVRNTISQFRVGLLNEPLAATLRLQELENNPPPFARLMQTVRKEETLQAERDAHRARSVKVQQMTCDPTPPALPSPKQTRKADDSIQVLQQQLVAQGEELKKLRSQFGNQGSKQQKSSKSKFKGFCYNCGKDHHKSHECNSPSNPEYVQQRLQNRKAKKSSNE